MKSLVLRVNRASLTVNDEIVVSIGKGIVVFVGFKINDSNSQLMSMANKVANLRIFENKEGKMHYSVKDKGYEMLCVPNFTLYANTAKGCRPSFEQVMKPEQANKCFNEFLSILSPKGIHLYKGVFGQHMDISVALDGPVNIDLEV